MPCSMGLIDAGRGGHGRRRKARPRPEQEGVVAVHPALAGSESAVNVAVAEHPPITSSNVYYVYTTTARELQRYEFTGSGRDTLKADVDNGSIGAIPEGARIRLHYPMQSYNGNTYMTEASVDERTGKFSLNHVMIYADGDGCGGEPDRCVLGFEV